MMTNQTVVFSIADTDAGTGIAFVTDLVNQFIEDSIASGKMNFEILPVVVSTIYSAGSPIEKSLYTVQVNYYDPAVNG